MDRGLAPCETLLQGQSLLPAHCYEGSWEVGRLVLAPEYRSGPEALGKCLFLTLMHLVQTTNIRNVFAVCTPLLSRLYRRFGCSVIVKDACEGPTEKLSLIHGKASSVLLALAGNDAERSLAELQLARRKGR
jgi:N-acyl-L-homoserine lactone synthetase